MAFGFKLKHVKTKEPFADTKALYERIKDERFYAGKPELVKNGLADVIVFPALDSQNQVWVMMFGKHRIQVQKKGFPPVLHRYIYPNPSEYFP